MRTLPTTLFIASVISFLFISCTNLNDSWVDLGDGYTFNTDSEDRSIFPNQTYHNTQIYSHVTDYKFNDRYIIAKQKPNYEHYKSFIGSDYGLRFRIYSKFLLDSTSKTFIDETTPFIRVAIRNDSLLYRLLKSKGVTDQNEMEDMETIQTILDSVFHADPFYVRLFSSSENYWIIDKDNNFRLGPFSKTDFDKECKQRQVKIKFD